MKNWTIGKRIVFGFAAITLIAVILGVTGYFMFARVSTEVAALSQHALPAVSSLPAKTGTRQVVHSALI
jgi:CHASE3 domain sensor protein